MLQLLARNLASYGPLLDLTKVGAHTDPLVTADSSCGDALGEKATILHVPSTKYQQQVPSTN